MAVQETGIVAMVDLPQGITPEVLVKRMAVWQDLHNKLLTSDDIQVFKLKDGKEKAFKKRSAWRKLALAFNISDDITKEEKEEKDGEVIWRIYVRAMAPNGRFAMGVGACSSKEKKFATPSGSERIVHDVFATAHTRAKNRAISDLLGAGEVSAEEITSDDKAEEEKPAEKPAAEKTMSELCSKLTTILELPIRNGLVAVSEDNTYISVKAAKPLTNEQQDSLDKILEQFHPFMDVSAKTWKVPKA